MEVNLRSEVFAHHVPVVDASLTVEVCHFTQRDRVDDVTPASDHLLLLHVGLLFLRAGVNVEVENGQSQAHNWWRGLAKEENTTAAQPVWHTSSIS